MFFLGQVAEIQEIKLNHVNVFKVSASIILLNISLAKVSHIDQTDISGVRKFPSSTIIGYECTNPL